MNGKQRVVVMPVAMRIFVGSVPSLDRQRRRLARTQVDAVDAAAQACSESSRSIDDADSNATPSGSMNPVLLIVTPSTRPSAAKPPNPRALARIRVPASV